MEDNNLRNWIGAAPVYAQVKRENIYSCFCKTFADHYFSDISNLRVLDAGCGDGEYTELFRQKGADATGCDGSEEVIKMARKRYPSCQFDVVDLLGIMPYRGGQFDLVFCNLVLMDIDPIHLTIREIARVLKNRGRFFFSIVHPAFYLADWQRNEDGMITHKKVTSYITSKSIKQYWDTKPVMHYHRPVSYYFNMLAENGLAFSKMYEPQVYEAAKIPDIPLYLFAEFTRA